MSVFGYYAVAAVSAAIGFAAAAVLSSGRDDGPGLPLRCYQCRHYHGDTDRQAMPTCGLLESNGSELRISPLQFCAWGEKGEGDVNGAS